MCVMSFLDFLNKCLKLHINQKHKVNTYRYIFELKSTADISPFNMSVSQHYNALFEHFLFWKA